MNKILLFIGIVLLVCPVVMRAVERHRQSDIVATYESEMNAVSDEQIQTSLEQARAYNERLYQEGWVSEETYRQHLNPNNQSSAIIGSLSIPKIGVKLPIRHGTSEEVLSSSVGHMMETSLPVGGNNTHSVLTGHRGVPSAELFTRLDELEEGDSFMITVCKAKLIYQVCDIHIVEPEDVGSISIQEGRDLVSLVTCTPYGINTHRLVVTGERVISGDQVIMMEAEQKISKWNAIPCAIAVVCSALAGGAWLHKTYRHRKGAKHEKKRKHRSEIYGKTRRTLVLHKNRGHEKRKLCARERISKK